MDLTPSSKHAPQDCLDEYSALTELLDQATRLDLHRRPGPQLTELLLSIFSLEAAAILDADLDETYCAGHSWPGLENQLRNLSIFETRRDEPETGLHERVLRLNHLPIGSMLLRGELRQTTVDAITALVTITFDRYHSLASEARSQSAHQAEQLRTTVLDHLAHAYKTPLTAIRAACTGLADTRGLSATQQELLGLIDEQTELLSTLTTRLLETARLEDCELILHTETVHLRTLIEEVLTGLDQELSSMPVQLVLPGQEVVLEADRALLHALLTQLLDNAAKYADVGTTITLGMDAQPDGLLLSVHNFGPVIPPSEQERIFDRYVRAEATAHRAAGTGLGLAIARSAAQAHGGDLWVSSHEQEGTTFYATIPYRTPHEQTAEHSSPSARPAHKTAHPDSAGR